MLCNQFTDSWNEFRGNFHYGLSRIFICRFVFGDGLIICLLLIMFEHSTDSLLVPTGWKFILFHLFPFLRSRRR